MNTLSRPQASSVDAKTSPNEGSKKVNEAQKSFWQRTKDVLGNLWSPKSTAGQLIVGGIKGATIGVLAGGALGFGAELMNIKFPHNLNFVNNYLNPSGAAVVGGFVGATNGIGNASLNNKMDDVETRLSFTQAQVNAQAAQINSIENLPPNTIPAPVNTSVASKTNTGYSIHPAHDQQYQTIPLKNNTKTPTPSNNNHHQSINSESGNMNQRRPASPSNPHRFQQKFA